MNPTVEELVQRLSQLKGSRGNFETQWQEVKDLLFPDTGDYNTERSPGEKTNLDIFDMDPVLALERGAAVLETFLTPRTQRWHRLQSTDKRLNESPRVKDFFEAGTDALFLARNSHRSRFSNESNLAYKSLLMTGNADTFVYPLMQGGIGYRDTHIGKAWIDVDYDRQVDTHFKEYQLTAKAAVSRWGEKAPRCARDVVASTPFREHTYLHAVFPNDAYQPGSQLPARMKFSAIEACIDDKTILEVGGFHEMPYIVSRYTLNPGEVYGRGPGMLFLPEIKTLQEMEKTFLRSGQKVADPPLLTVDDGELGRGRKRIRLSAGGVTAGGLNAQGQPQVVPLNTGARLDITHEMQQERRKRIRSAFFLDVWEILVEDRTPMTATEFLGRLREKGQLLSPVVGRQQSERLGPMIEREIGILQRQGRIPPLPPELVEAKGEYDIEYVSDATRMQKAAEVEAYPRTFEALGPLFEANPSLLAIWKSYEAVTSTFEVLGGSTRAVNTRAEWDRILKAQAEVEAEAELRENAPVAAKTLRDVSGAAKDLRAVA